MRIDKYIVTDPRVCHGKPCFRDTRIMVYLVLEMLAAGETPEKIIKAAYPQLTKRHIEAALWFAARTTGARESEAIFFPLAHAAKTAG